MYNGVSRRLGEPEGSRSIPARRTTVLARNPTTPERYLQAHAPQRVERALALPVAIHGEIGLEFFSPARPRATIVADLRSEDATTGSTLATIALLAAPPSATAVLQQIDGIVNKSFCSAEQLARVDWPSLVERAREKLAGPRGQAEQAAGL